MTEETNVQETKETQAPEAAPAEEKATADLNVADLVAIKNVIEVASSRGAFKPNEFEAVGKIFNKLSSFLDAVAANNQKDQ